MTKAIRPERIFADPMEDAVIVEYVVQVCDENIVKISSHKEQMKVYTNPIDAEADISNLAKKVIKKCKYIPHQWISQVEDVLAEIQQRAFEDDSCGSESHEVDDPMELVVKRLDSILELLYGSTNEKILVLLEVLSFCRRVDNLEVIVQHHSMMSALARIISDQSSYSVHVTFMISKVFLALSNFEVFHSFLSKYRVGAIIMSVITQEAKRTETSSSDIRSRNTTRHHCVIYICVSILMRLSDDMMVLQKMMKKDLFNVILRCLAMDIDTVPKAGVLFLLRRASAFGEVVEACNGEGQHQTIKKLVSLLVKANNTLVDANSLNILNNLSFDRQCQSNMLIVGVQELLPSLLTKSTTRHTALTLLYNLSSELVQRPHITNLEFKTAIIQSLLVFDKTKCVDKYLGAALMNLTCSPFWAEVMIPHVMNLLNLVDENQDILLAKVVRNLALWTRRLQECIHLAFSTQDCKALLYMTTDPTQYLLCNEDESISTTKDPFTNYRNMSFWGNGASLIAHICSTSDFDEIILEMMATINRFTQFDLPLCDTWDTLLSEHSMLSLLRKIVMPGMNAMDLKLEAIILCNQVCQSGPSAKMIENSNLINHLLQVWEECSSDVKVHLHILHLCETLFGFEETRNAVLLGTDAMQHIFDSLEHDNESLRYTAERCVDLLADYNCLEDSIDNRFAFLAKERRFMVYNSEWIQSKI